MRWHYSLFLFIISQSCIHNTFIPCTYLLLLQLASRLVYGFCNCPFFFDFRQGQEYFSSFQIFQTESGPTQPPVHWSRRPFPRIKAAGLWNTTFTSILFRAEEFVEPYLHFPICLPRVHRNSFTFVVAAWAFAAILTLPLRWYTTRRTMGFPM